MRTASERRAAGEAPFCDCGGCVLHACAVADDFAANGPGVTRGEADEVSIMLRALVIAALLDPATWARAEGWRP